MLKLYEELAYLESLISFFLEACERHKKNGDDVIGIEFEARSELVKKGEPIIRKIYSYAIKTLLSKATSKDKSLSKLDTLLPMVI